MRRRLRMQHTHAGLATGEVVRDCYEYSYGVRVVYVSSTVVRVFLSRDTVWPEVRHYSKTPAGKYGEYEYRTCRARRARTGTRTALVPTRRPEESLLWRHCNPG